MCTVSLLLSLSLSPCVVWWSHAVAHTLSLPGPVSDISYAVAAPSLTMEASWNRMKGKRDELRGRDGRGGLSRQAMLIDSLYNMTEFFFSLPAAQEGETGWIDGWQGPLSASAAALKQGGAGFSPAALRMCCIHKDASC